MAEIYYPNAEQIAQYKTTLAQNGFLFLETLPVSFDHLLFAQEFGKLMRQYDGSVIWSVKPDPQFDDLYHSRNTKKLLPHTECYEFEGLPPKYLVLWCTKPADDGGGQTLLYDSFEYLSSINDEDRNLLMTRPVTYNASSGISKTFTLSARHRIVTPSDSGNPIVRFSRNCMEHGGDADLERIAQHIVDTFESKHFAINWLENSFLIWDNQRMLHNRTSFSDCNRELQRLWMTSETPMLIPDRAMEMT